MKSLPLHLTAAALLLSVVGCGSGTAPSADAVMQKLGDSGFVSNVRTVEHDPTSLLPNTYRDHVVFEIEDVKPNGGQVFVCNESKHCDVLYQHYKGLQGLAGPYIYRSKSGLVVAQLNSGLKPDRAEQVYALIQDF